MARRQDLHTRLSVPSSRRFSTHELARAWLATLAATLLAQARAEDSSPAVDLELVLAVDVSSSMTKDELRVQRGGYVSALRDPQVVSAILSGARGRIAIAYFEWASPEHQRLLMPWTVVDGPASIEAFAAGLETQPIGAGGGASIAHGLAGGGTSISGGLSFASRLLQSNTFRGERQIVDVSGDGPNNCGAPISPAREALVARGATINGLAISRRGSPDVANSLDEGNLGWYYEGCVIGGPGAFVIAVSDEADFGTAVRRKLVREIAATRPWIQLAAAIVQVRPDCLALEQFPRR
jgi:hypothetical protein